MAKPQLLPDVIPPGMEGVVKLYKTEVNGITVRYADTADAGESGEQLPLVLFLHGWPESWYSYRHQLKECKQNNFRGVAPDMRGYGSTSAPLNPEEYNVYALAGDAIGLINMLGYKKCMLVGHDHGAGLAWKLKLMYPDIFVVLCALSVPYSGRSKFPGLESMRRTYGVETDKENANFFYQLHHQLPEAASEYDANAEEALLRLYAVDRGLKKRGILHGPEITSKKMYIDGKARGWWWRMPKPAGLPPWITQGEFDYYVSEYKRAGFHGGLQWYISTTRRDLDWTLTKALSGKKVKGPILFVAGGDDVVIHWAGGKDPAVRNLTTQCVETPECVIIDNCGHWIQQEAKEEVNQALFPFLNKHRGKLIEGSKL